MSVARLTVGFDASPKITEGRIDTVGLVPTVAVSGLGEVDLTQLPVSVAVAPQSAAYAALNSGNGVPAASAGFQYNDPYTGVLVTKVSSRSVPVTNNNVSHDYGAGPLQISRAWGASLDQYTILYNYALSDGGNRTQALVDYQLGGTLSNYRDVPLGLDLVATFSKNPATDARILYTNTGGQIRRYNTQTDAFADTGVFPISVSGSQRQWFQNTFDDDIFAWQDNSINVAYAYKVGVATEVNTPSPDEIQMDNGGTLAFIFTGNSVVRSWNMLTDTIDEGSQPGYNAPPDDGLFHTAVQREYVVSWVDTAAPPPRAVYVQDITHPVGASGTEVPTSGYSAGFHAAAQWYQPTGNRDQAYILQDEEQATGLSVTHIFRNAAAMIRLDGGDTRTICHLYTGVDFSGDYYKSQAHTTQSYDGKLIMWTSCMEQSGAPESDLFVAELPRA